MSSYFRLLNRLQGIKLQFHGLGIYLVILVVASSVTGGIIHHTWLTLKTIEISPDEQKLNKLKSDLQVKRNELASKTLELKLANETNQNMQQIFAKQIEKQKDLERELAFYRSVMAPEEFANGVAINGLELAHGVVRNQFRLKLVLTQLKKIKKPIKGFINIQLVGEQNEKPHEIELSKLIKGSLKFNYRYFQVIETDFILPDDFNLGQLVVNVVVPKTRWSKGSKAKQTFNVSELLSDKDTRVLLEQNGQVTDNLS